MQQVEMIEEQGHLKLKLTHVGFVFSSHVEEISLVEENK